MNGVQQTVIYEQAMDLNFLDEIYHIPGGEKIKDCIQCGTCSGSCPVSWAMEETPRQIFAMIRAGMRDKVLGQHHDLDLCILLSMHAPLSSGNQNHGRHVHAQKNGHAGKQEAKQERRCLIESIL